VDGTLGSSAALHISEQTSKECHEAAVRLVAEIAGYFSGKEINELIFVPLTIMSRIIRTYEAAALLLKEQYNPEAAVLILTQFELRFDLLYVASDITRATEWVEHENLKAMSATMRAKLVSLYKPIEADRLYETFGYLSGIKHGNPIYSELAFPGRGRRNRYVVSTGSIDDQFAKAFADALLAYTTYQLVWAAQVVNKLIAPYTAIERTGRLLVHSQYMTQKSVENRSRLFLRNRISKRKTFFGIKGLLKSVQPKETSN
jgi:hypothetical protein